MIIFYTGLLVPFAVFFLANFFRTVPQELIEAASVEGAGPFTVLRRVVMPLSGAAAFTLVIVQAIWVWNELLIALVFLQDENARTLNGGPRAVPGPLRDEPAARPRRRARLDPAGRAALPLGPALLRARAHGRHRQVAVSGVERREHVAALPHAVLGDRVEHEDRLVGARLGEVVQRARDLRPERP